MLNVSCNVHASFCTFPCKNVDPQATNVATVNLFHTKEELMQSVGKRNHLKIHAATMKLPYAATPTNQLFRVYTPSETPKKTSHLVDRLIGEKLKKSCCEKCAITEWRTLSIGAFLEGHHKDGNPLNNSVENLSILCPNCHKLEHVEGIPLPGEFPSCNFDLDLPDVKKIQQALGPVLKRRDMRALARELNIPLDRLELIGKSCFRHLWFPATERRGPRDFLTVEGLEAIKRSLAALQKCNFRYDDTRASLRNDPVHGVPETFFIYIYKRFKGAWKNNNFITDPALLPTETELNP